MFNLLMFNVDWRQGRVTVPSGRIFEYTDREIANRFEDDGSPAFDRLISLPCLFSVEGTTDETAYIGKINRARLVGKEISLEVSLDTDAPPLRNNIRYLNNAEGRGALTTALQSRMTTILGH